MSRDASPLDKAVGRTSPDKTAGPDNLDNDIHETPKTLWAAVLLMCAGAALIGGAIVALDMNHRAALALAIAGVVVGLIGAGIGLRNGIMNNVE